MLQSGFPRPLLLMLLVSVVGCGGSDADPNLVQVSGSVTLSGQPVKSGVVGFVGDGGKSVFSGEIEDGQYTLKAGQAAPGALPGNYRVSIRAWESEPTMDAEGKPVPGKESIPKKYFETATSGLEATVAEDGGEIDFDLKP